MKFQAWTIILVLETFSWVLRPRSGLLYSTRSRGEKAINKICALLYTPQSPCFLLFWCTLISKSKNLCSSAKTFLRLLLFLVLPEEGCGNYLRNYILCILRSVLTYFYSLCVHSWKFVYKWGIKKEINCSWTFKIDICFILLINIRAKLII